jgi:putative ATP-binding cassette transporter
LFGLSTASRTGFVVALLYLIGPVRSLLSLIPAAIQAKVAWRRLSSLPAGDDPFGGVRPGVACGTVGSLELVDVRFQYPESGGYSASVGPVSLRLRAGEMLFISGGNGSGKTTLAKVICGLYPASSGRVVVDGIPVAAGEDNGLFAVTFNPCFVFRHEYRGGGDPRETSEMWARFELPRYGTNEPLAVNQLSSGQRKRVAIGEALLQKRPILIFDEPAADQAPGFRSYFYDTLLRELTAAGKIVIVITHDQAYFHLADQLLSLDLGQVAKQSQMREELSASGR